VSVVSFQFVATGQDSVVAAFRSINTAAQQSARIVSQAFTANENAATRSSARAAAAQERGATQGARAADRAAQQAAKASERESKAAEKAAERKLKATQKAEAQRWKEVEQTARRIEQASEREAKAAEKAAERKAAAAKRQEKARTQATAKSVVGMAGDLGSWALKGVAGLGMAAAGTVGAAAREGFELRDITNRLGTSSREAGGKFESPEAMAREFENIATRTPGQKASEIALGAQAFVTKTGKLDKARDFSETFATTASATGAKVEDIASAAADLFKQFKIEKIEDMRDALAALTFQGKNGAFEIKDMASQMARIGSAATRFGLDKSVQGVKVLGGLTQIARGATGSSEQAATAVEATMRQLVAKAPDLKKAGVKVFEKSGNARDVRDVLVDAITKVGGSNIEKKKIGLQNIFGDEGIRAISPLISAFAEASMGAKGGDKEKKEAGASAVRKTLEESINAAGAWGDVVDDAAQAQKNSSAQLTLAWEALKAKASDELIPALVPLIEKLPEFVDAMEPVIEVLKIFAEGLLDVVQFLKSKGLISEKEKTPAQQAKEAQSKLDAMNSKLARVGASEFSHTDKDLAKAGINPAEYKKARDAAITLREAQWTTVKKTSMTSADFADRYAAAGDQSVDEATRKERANKVALRALQDPTKERGYMDFWGKLAGETKEQRGLRHNFEEQTAFDKSQAQWNAAHGTNGTEDATARQTAAQLQEVNQALREFQATLQASGQASIAPGQ
jgi:Phage-related minor tail protein